MLHIIFALVGAVLGGLVLDLEGVGFGFALGLLFAQVLSLTTRVSRLEHRLESAQRPIPDSMAQAAPVLEPPASAPARPPSDLPLPEAPVPRQEEPANTSLVFDVDLDLPEPVDDHRVVTSWEADLRPRPATVRTKAAPKPSLIDHCLAALKSFFTRGNIVVRVGMVVVFFGVAFLLKYAVDKNVFPIEARLVATSVGALVMFWFGWRLRLARTVYALVLQGGAIGVWYLVTYAGAQYYNLLPLGLAFALMLGLVIAAGLLSVLQDSRAFATMGAIGGFLAPILCASGSSDHVLLFSYYAFLNVGIFAVAWFKSWRELNLIGFFFTFAIATTWGVLDYKPSLFATTEPFLILYFALYFVISILYAYRQPPRLRGFVDATLVFGLPLVAIALQGLLVRDFEYGLAWSAVGLSATYLLACVLLWRRRDGQMRVLIEAFLALGVIFASLAVPFALDGRWTSITWALEGAAMVWVGIRQTRLLSRNFGLALQIGAGVFFLASIPDDYASTPIFNGLFLGSAIVSVAGLFSSWQLERACEKLKPFERYFHWPFLIWGLMWWLGGSVHEIAEHVADVGNQQPNALVLLFSGTFVAVSVLATLLQWRAVRWTVPVVVPVVTLIAIGVTADDSIHLFEGWGAPVWLVAAVALYWLLARNEHIWPPWLCRSWHVLCQWLFVSIITVESLWSAQNTLSLNETWTLSLLGVIPGLSLLAILAFSGRVKWPFGHYHRTTTTYTLGAIALALLAWFALACFSPSEPEPLAFVPIVNPLDLAQLFTLIVVARWIHYCRRETITPVSDVPMQFLWLVIGTGLFVWLNVVLARTVHIWTDVAYRFDPLFDSRPLQASIAILWTVGAFALMACAKRFHNRSAWMFGAALLGAVIVKIFLVDLSGTGTVARIVTFLGVGVLMLIIGFFAPLPPTKMTQDAS